MNIYTDEILNDLREWCKNNPLIFEELGHERVPGCTKGMPSWNKGLPMTDNHKSNISKSKKGKKQSIDHKEKIGARFRAIERNRTMLQCPHCNKTNNVGNSKRWHFDNCKSKP